MSRSFAFNTGWVHRPTIGYPRASIKSLDLRRDHALPVTYAGSIVRYLSPTETG